MFKKSLLLIGLVCFSLLTLHSQNAALTSPQNGIQLTSGDVVELNTLVNSVIPGQPIHISAYNTLSGYRKLKIGNNPNSIYSPKVNVSGAGNTTLKLVLRDTSGTTDWSKIRFKPQSQGSLNLSSYVTAAGGVGSDWTTVTIPLSDFDPTIDFTQIAFIEFPYSADAGNFNIDIAEISFTGSAYPYEWFGETKNNNIINGNGGPGEIFASLVQGTPAVGDVVKVEFLVDNSVVATDFDYPFSYSYPFAIAGNYSVSSVVYYTNSTTELTNGAQVLVSDPVQANVSALMSTDATGNIIEEGTPVSFTVDVSGANPTQQEYLKVVNNQSGYRKLKMGYDPNNIYAQGQNVYSGGNTHLQICLREVSGFANWNKIRIKPNAIGSMNIESYVSAAGGVGPDWKWISIPLSDFDASINFYSISYFEFPYSADAGNFEIHIKDMKFTGGPQDFIWFGEGKTDNAQNGNGGPGELSANLIQPANSGILISKVDFYQNGNLIDEDLYQPYTLENQSLTAGNYEFYSEIFTSDGATTWSDTIILQVNPPAVNFSELGISWLNPTSSGTKVTPTNINLIAAISGIPIPEPTHLLVTNSQSGYRKLKFGYSSANIYNPGNNVISGGNDTLIIILKDFSGVAQWNKIRLKPASIGSVNLAPYIPAGVGTDWFTIRIPLSDFDPSIDFTNLAFMEFPYSADAGYMELGIQRVEFTGGTTPFLWFGDNKTDNAHNGNGGSGELVANLIEQNNNPIAPTKVEFFDDSTLLGEALADPWELPVSFADTAIHNLWLKLSDNVGAVAFSDTLAIETAPPSNKSVVLNITLDSTVPVTSVDLAPLKYNKDFAYSFTLDDGRADAYTIAYPMMNGGYSADVSTTFPGLFYTDGCGNAKNFKLGLAWYSVSSNGNDLHINTPDFITWTQLSEMYNSGWDVINHSYSHAAYTNVDYNAEIVQNETIVNQQTGIPMSVLVPPSGDTAYNSVAFGLGYKAIFGNNTSYQGYSSGLDVDLPLNYQNLKIFRHFLSDYNYDTTNISQTVDAISLATGPGNHLWFNESTHRVKPVTIGGSLIYSTYSWYMNHLQNAYGINGLDNMWFAGVQEVYEYLRLRDESNIAWSQNGNQLQVIIDYNTCPDNLRNYALSLLVQTEGSINSVSSSFATVDSYNNSGPAKLINLSWNGNSLANKMAPMVDPVNESVPVPDEILVYPNPTNNHLITLRFPASDSDNATIFIYDVVGRIIQSKQLTASELSSGEINLRLKNIEKGNYLLMFKGEHSYLKTIFGVQ